VQKLFENVYVEKCDKINEIKIKVYALFSIYYIMHYIVFVGDGLAHPVNFGRACHEQTRKIISNFYQSMVYHVLGNIFNGYAYTRF